jgi:hypothetical protein
VIRPARFFANKPKMMFRRRRDFGRKHLYSCLSVSIMVQNWKDFASSNKTTLSHGGNVDCEAFLGVLVGKLYLPAANAVPVELLSPVTNRS